MHQGYRLKQNGFGKPAEAHFSITLTLNKKSANVKNWNQSEAKRRWRKI